MAYTNSKLVSYTKLSPNYNSRGNKRITKITIHHMAGNLTVEKCGAMFAEKSRKASSNYGVGTDGRIAMYVEEKNRSWCSSNATNDYQAITIEVANCGGAPDWKVSDKALDATIELCVDICKRNGIKELNFTGNSKGNLTLHKYFAATECPGKYLESKIPYIVKEVNKKLNPTTTTANNNKATVNYKVKVTAKTLNVRAGAGTGYKINTTVKINEIYTIIEEKKVGSATWGKLKSGAGWICLTGYTQKQK